MHVYVYMYEIYVYEMVKAAYLLRSVTLRTRELKLNLIKSVMENEYMTPFFPLRVYLLILSCLIRCSCKQRHKCMRSFLINLYNWIL